MRGLGWGRELRETEDGGLRETHAFFYKLILAQRLPDTDTDTEMYLRYKTPMRAAIDTDSDRSCTGTSQSFPWDKSYWLAIKWRQQQQQTQATKKQQNYKSFGSQVPNKNLLLIRLVRLAQSTTAPPTASTWIYYELDFECQSTLTHWLVNIHWMGINKYFVARLNIHPGGQFFVKIFSVRFEFVFATDLVESGPLSLSFALCIPISLPIYKSQGGECV